MKTGWLLVAFLALLVTTSGTPGCDNGTILEPEPVTEPHTTPTPEVSDSDKEVPADSISGGFNFNLIFRYGVMSKNILDTFQGTFSKDMVRDPSITIDLSLSQEEMDSIYQKMVEIDFFNYPDEFKVPVPPDGLVQIVTPYSSYYFRVKYGSEIKELRWKDEIKNENIKADKLRELIKLIRDIIESKEEYQKLPEPTSGYL